jgi:hypothetical protein
VPHRHTSFLFREPPRLEAGPCAYSNLHGVCNTTMSKRARTSAFKDTLRLQPLTTLHQRPIWKPNIRFAYLLSEMSKSTNSPIFFNLTSWQQFPSIQNHFAKSFFKIIPSRYPPRSHQSPAPPLITVSIPSSIQPVLRSPSNHNLD